MVCPLHTNFLWFSISIPSRRVGVFALPWLTLPYRPGHTKIRSEWHLRYSSRRFILIKWKIENVMGHYQGNCIISFIETKFRIWFMIRHQEFNSIRIAVAVWQWWIPMGVLLLDFCWMIGVGNLHNFLWYNGIFGKSFEINNNLLIPLVITRLMLAIHPLPGAFSYILNGGKTVKWWLILFVITPLLFSTRPPDIPNPHVLAQFVYFPNDYMEIKLCIE